MVTPKLVDSTLGLFPLPVSTHSCPKHDPSTNLEVMFMAWIIDKDHFAEPGVKPGTNDNAVGIIGPSSYEGDGSDLTKKFRMLTDDGDVVYEGRCDTDDDENALG